MTSSSELIELELNLRIDEWLASRQVPATQTTAELEGGGGALDDDARSELEELVSLLDLVASSENGVGAEGSGRRLRRIESRRRPVRMRSANRSPWSTRAVAVLLLVVAVGLAALAIVARRPSSENRPLHKGAGIPAALLSDVESQAGFGGDPYPTQPLLWVKTTYARVRNVSQNGWAFTGDHVPGSTPVWVAVLRGSFYGDPATRTDVYHEYWSIYAAGSKFPELGGIGDLGGLHRIGQLPLLGTVHQLLLVAPPAKPLFRSLPQTMASQLEATARANHEPYPAEPVLWAKTTAGTLRHSLDAAALASWPAITAVAGHSPAWVVYCASCSGDGSPTVLWELAVGTGASQRSGWFGAPPSPVFSGVAALHRFGQVYEDWIAPSLPTSLPPFVLGSVASDLTGRYLLSPGERVPRTVDGLWSVTTVAALEARVAPQVNDNLTSVPGNAPIWVLDLYGLPTWNHTSGPDWVIVTANPPGSGTVVPWYARGGSPLLGITSPAQLGPLHYVTFRVAKDGLSVSVERS